MVEVWNELLIGIPNENILSYYVLHMIELMTENETANETDDWDWDWK